ncbi:RHS-family protein [bacterium endosymbiont of Bathymodiolus sp. 5 South]|nr:RHS-family protein [bacterium endosymbiont of Bathymodiolus sp. 5 South]
MQDKNGKVIAYSAYNPNTGNNILMKPEELSTFKASVENNLGYNIENTPNYQHTISNAAAGLHDDGKTGGILNSWGQYAKSDDIIFDVAGGLGGSIALRTSSKVVGKVVGKIKKYTPINPGPLDKRIADTFRSSSYTEKITPKEIVLYRVISKNGNPTGNYLTRAKPRGPLASVIDSSLDQNWGNTATKIVKLKIPKGIKLYEGVAAPQKGLVGGGNQIYLPKIDKNWVIK